MQDYFGKSRVFINPKNNLPRTKSPKVLGGFLLGNKNKDEWRSALHKLEKTPDQKVQSVLRVSYDRLENEIKSTFLDIACFF